MTNYDVDSLQKHKSSTSVLGCFALVEYAVFSRDRKIFGAPFKKLSSTLITSLLECCYENNLAFYSRKHTLYTLHIIVYQVA